MIDAPRDILDLQHGVRALFQPNAPGRRELRCAAGLRRRQVLKSYGQYLAERVELVVGVSEVTAWRGRASRGALICRRFRDEVFAVALDAVGPRSAAWPAFALVDLRDVVVVAELRAVRDDAESRRVLDLLRLT
ncbi:MAG TPA: hypothetical protein VJM33_16540 [Microthrixaceae bacterium]|nr:hypothetical protein [Microthrixaceae bacterium]